MVNLDDVNEQTDLQTEWEETEDGILADIATEMGRIQDEVEFHNDGSVTETVTVLDENTNELVTETVEYDWEEVQREFLKSILRDLTDRAGDSRRIRLTASEASAITSAAEKVADLYEGELNPEAVEDIRAGCSRIRDAFETDPEPRANAGEITD